MNSIVVKLNQETENLRSHRYRNYHDEQIKSTLTHASEKAIESYFCLFHLLICLATSDPSIVQDANRALREFKNGRTNKEHCPNLGHLLVAALVSEEDVTEMITGLIKEAITRNAVWMLEGNPELACLEVCPSATLRHVQYTDPQIVLVHFDVEL